MVRMFGVLYSYFSIVFLTLTGYINRLMVFHENKNESCRVSDTTFPTSIDLFFKFSVFKRKRMVVCQTQSLIARK